MSEKYYKPGRKLPFKWVLGALFLLPCPGDLKEPTAPGSLGHLPPYWVFCGCSFGVAAKCLLYAEPVLNCRSSIERLLYARPWAKSCPCCLVLPAPL